ncbi:MAG: asparagine synthase (glutamine-hydrolyzing) [Cyclobacteriaceae bacterium]
MCGILFSINGDLSLESLKLLRHRGPDNQEIWRKANVTIGHTRLSIVDLSTEANQPFHNEDNSIHLTCNGEIYNADELRSILISKGHFFNSKSDNEVILHGYEEWSSGILDRLTGMFAFVIWDERLKRVFAARDHVGIKPLYYFNTRESFVAASELTVIKRDSSELNPIALGYYLGLGYIPSPLTLYKEYSKIEPGHYILWNERKGLSTHKYWEPPTDIKDGKEDFTELFHEVVSDHLMADVPIGTFLSGGLDSTSIVVALKELGYSTEALTIGFPESKRNESAVAAETARSLAFPQSIIDLYGHDVMSLIRKSSQIYDEPQGFSALLTMIQVCEVAAKNYKVVLSGDGGDEIFGGYNWYKNIGGIQPNYKSRFANRWLYMLTSNKRFLRSEVFSNISDLHQHAWRLFPRFLPEQINRLLSDYQINFNEDDLLEPLRKHFVTGLPLKRALQRVDLMTFCADSINPKVDRASMAFSMEVRVPFLDKRMIEYGLSLPLEKRFENQPKQVLRNYLRNRVPESVLRQPKQGFSARMFAATHFEEMKKFNLNNSKYLDYDSQSLNDSQEWLIYNLHQNLNRN